MDFVLIENCYSDEICSIDYVKIPNNKKNQDYRWRFFGEIDQDGKRVEYFLNSEEEYHFVLWLIELFKTGFINHWHYEPKKYTLNEPKSYFFYKKMKTKVKLEEKKVFQYSYTPDFFFSAEPKFTRIFNHQLSCVNGMSYDIDSKFGTLFIVDTKGSGSASKNRANTSAITFGIKQVMLFTQHGHYVNKVVPVKLFEKTFVPRHIAFDKRRKAVMIKDIYKKCELLTAYLGMK